MARLARRPAVRSVTMRRQRTNAPNRTSATMPREAILPTADTPPEDSPPHPVGRALSGQQFWDLMARWRVPDAPALELIGYPGKLGASGKRPRFRFNTRQQRMSGYLAEIDAALAAANRDVAWLHRRITGPPFARRTPLGHMIA